MSERKFTYDVVVIGAGLAGLMAALGARAAGADVAVVAEGGGAVELSSGSIDLLAGSWAALAETHPYHLVGADAVRQGLDAFLAAAGAMGLPYKEDVDRRNQMAVTAVGALRPTYLPAPGAAMVQPGERVHVVGFRGLREFHPGVVAEGLRRAEVEAAWAWADLPGPVRHPLQIARLLEEPDYRSAFISRLRDAGQPAPGSLLLLPAVLGLERAAAVRAELSAAVGLPVAEVPLLSPSLPGLRLGTALARHVQRAGADLHLGVCAVGAVSEQGRVVSITCQTAAGTASYRARAFVLATGGLLGRGHSVGAPAIFEPIFGLPVSVPSGPLAAPDLLSADGHAFVRAGIRADELLRPAGWSNLHICGKMLAGYDPYAEGCGGGVAIATGWRAGELAGGAAR